MLQHVVEQKLGMDLSDQGYKKLEENLLGAARIDTKKSQICVIAQTKVERH